MVRLSNSPLVTYTRLSPNCTKPRNHKIDTITIHCTAGQGTAKQILDMAHFNTYNPTNGSSCNYAVGKDGSIGLCVDEANRSWCSSNKTNDHRAITIEVSSDSKPPYAVTDAAYKALINLLVDICQRNGINKLVWSANKADRVNHRNGCNMTCHRDYAQKSCPGDYLYSLEGQIAAEVNERLEDNEDMDISRLTDAQVLELANRIDAIRGKETVSDWAASAWSSATSKGVFDGTAPKNPFTREQAATVLSRLELI